MKKTIDALINQLSDHLDDIARRAASLTQTETDQLAVARLAVRLNEASVILATAVRDADAAVANAERDGAGMVR